MRVAHMAMVVTVFVLGVFALGTACSGGAKVSVSPTGSSPAERSVVGGGAHKTRLHFRRGLLVFPPPLASGGSKIEPAKARAARLNALLRQHGHQGSDDKPLPFDFKPTVAKRCSTQPLRFQLKPDGDPSFQAGTIVPRGKIKLVPHIPGTFRWLDYGVLAFVSRRPVRKVRHLTVAIPAEYTGRKKGTPARKVEVEVSVGCAVYGKVFGWHPQRGKPQLAFVTSQRSMALGEELPTAPLILLFDQPVQLAPLYRWIKVRASHGSKKWGLRFGLSHRPAKRSRLRRVLPRQAVNLTIANARRLKPGTTVWLELDAKLTKRRKSNISGDVDGDGEEHRFYSTKFKVPKRNKLSDLTTSGETEVVRDNLLKVKGFDTSESDSIEIRFSEGIHSSYFTKAGNAAFRGLVRITPRPRSYAVMVDPHNTSLQLSLRPGKTYRVRINKRLRDAHGYSMDSHARIVIHTKDLAPSLELPVGERVVESKSPLRLRLRSRNINWRGT